MHRHIPATYYYYYYYFSPVIGLYDITVAGYLCSLILSHKEKNWKILLLKIDEKLEKEEGEILLIYNF